MKTRIVFFGDSLVYGLRDSANGERFPLDERPHSYLQQLLGDNYQVIDEGLRSRTIGVDDPDRQDRNGFTYFRPCIESIEPEMVIIWLGTNNSKVRLLQSPETMIEQFDILIKWAKEKYPSMKIVVVPPPQIKTEYLNERMMDFFGDKAEGLIAMYQPVLSKYCADNDILYVHNAEKISADSVDGIHLSRQSNQEVAEYIYDVISKK